MDVSAKITGIEYSPFLGRNLNSFSIDQLAEALSSDATFILNIDKNRQIAMSWWRSAKRTRSYPYSRVYDSLSFQGKKATIIPIYKDEGKEGDRDYLEFDTVSLMSLLGIYTIISYYINAERSSRYRHKITKQKFDTAQVRDEIFNLLSYQSDALHWNLSQIDKAGEIGQKALDFYEKISKKLDVEMHSKEGVENRVQELLKGKESFMNLSRGLAKKAQKRESVTVQPKEKLSGKKATLTIKNYLGGHYHFTCDEAYTDKDILYLIEGKNAKESLIPSLIDIRDGLWKMILFTNLKQVEVDNTEYSSKAILKLTSNKEFSKKSLRKPQIERLKLLKKEAEINHFQVLINEVNLMDVDL